MHEPLIIALRPSPGVMASVSVAHVAAALALFHVPAFGLKALLGGQGVMQAVIAGSAGCVLFVSLIRALVQEWRKRRLHLVLNEAGEISLLQPAAPPLRGRVVPHSIVVFEWAVWFQSCPEFEGRMRPGRSRRFMIVAANLDAQQWRGLRIWLRHEAVRADAPDGRAA
ncbi:hypothetical protein [Thauera sp.]